MGRGSRAWGEATRKTLSVQKSERSMEVLLAAAVSLCRAQYVPGLGDYSLGVQGSHHEHSNYYSQGWVYHENGPFYGMLA